MIVYVIERTVVGRCFNLSLALLCLLMPLMPESPSHLMRSGKEAQVTAALAKLKWAEQDIRKEMKSIKEAQVKTEGLQ